MLSVAGRGRPAATQLFFASPKKSTQRKATRSSGSLRFATGNLRCSTTAGSAQTRFAQTARSLIRLRLCSSAQPGRGNRERERGTEYQIPKTNKDSPWRVLVSSGIHVFGFLLPAPCPLWMAPRSGGQTDQGSRCLSEASLRGDPVWTEHRRLPVAKRRDAATRVAFSLLTFFWRSKRRVSSRRATPANRPQQRTRCWSKTSSSSATGAPALFSPSPSPPNLHNPQHRPASPAPTQQKEEPPHIGTRILLGHPHGIRHQPAAKRPDLPNHASRPPR